MDREITVTFTQQELELIGQVVKLFPHSGNVERLAAIVDVSESVMEKVRVALKG